MKKIILSFVLVISFTGYVYGQSWTGKYNLAVDPLTPGSLVLQAIPNNGGDNFFNEAVNLLVVPQGLQYQVAPQGMHYQVAPQGMRYQVAPQGMRYQVAPQGMHYQVAPQGMHYQVAPQGMHYQVAPQGMHYQVAPQGVHYQVTPQGMHYQVAPQGVQYQVAPQGMHYQVAPQGVQYQVAPQGMHYQVAPQGVHYQTQSMSGDCISCSDRSYTLGYGSNASGYGGPFQLVLTSGSEIFGPLKKNIPVDLRSLSVPKNQSCPTPATYQLIDKRYRCDKINDSKSYHAANNVIYSTGVINIANDTSSNSGIIKSTQPKDAPKLRLVKFVSRLNDKTGNFHVSWHVENESNVHSFRVWGLLNNEWVEMTNTRILAKKSKEGYSNRYVSIITKDKMYENVTDIALQAIVFSDVSSFYGPFKKQKLYHEPHILAFKGKTHLKILLADK